MRPLNKQLPIVCNITNIHMESIALLKKKIFSNLADK